MKTIIFIAAILISIIGYSDYKKEKRREQKAEKEARCAASVQCSNEKADQLARLESISSIKLIQSTSGNVYFKGALCSPYCLEHISGYTWAEKYGISKSEGCTNNNNSFMNGCLQYVDVRVHELLNQDDTEQEPCETHGRYSDC